MTDFAREDEFQVDLICGFFKLLNHTRISFSQIVPLHYSLAYRRKRQVQKEFIEYTQSNLTDDPKIDELINWENRKEILEWLDSL